MAAAALHTQNELRHQPVAWLRAALEQARVENTLRRQKLDALARRRFDQKSEQLAAAQRQWLLAGRTQQVVAAAPSKALLPVAAPRRERRTAPRAIPPRAPRRGARSHRARRGQSRPPHRGSGSRRK